MNDALFPITLACLGVAVITMLMVRETGKSLDRLANATRDLAVTGGTFMDRIVTRVTAKTPLSPRGSAVTLEPVGHEAVVLVNMPTEDSISVTIVGPNGHLFDQSILALPSTR